MIYCFDLDGTLCTNTNGNYGSAQPFKDRIDKVNQLYKEGHTILIDTARGFTTKIDWYSVTENQLKEWGVLYHTLRVGEKLYADIFIDDKGTNDMIFFN
jgi:hypothetical protein